MPELKFPLKQMITLMSSVSTEHVPTSSRVYVQQIITDNFFQSHFQFCSIIQLELLSSISMAPWM